MSITWLSYYARFTSSYAFAKYTKRIANCHFETAEIPCAAMSTFFIYRLVKFFCNYHVITKRMYQRMDVTNVHSFPIYVCTYHLGFLSLSGRNFFLSLRQFEYIWLRKTYTAIKLITKNASEKWEILPTWRYECKGCLIAISNISSIRRLVFVLQLVWQNIQQIILNRQINKYKHLCVS